MIEDNILLVGCGKMGGALLEGMITQLQSPEQVVVVDVDAEGKGRFGVNVLPDVNCDTVKAMKIDTVILAVKPQMMDEVVDGLGDIVSDDALFISVAAGKTLAFFEKKLGRGKAIVRAMPNLPAVVGQAVTVMCRNKRVNEGLQARAEKIFAAVGSSYWLDDEKLLDAVTAVSGSGPAYVFYFMESLVSAAVKLGLPEDLALMLASSTVRGSAKLAGASDKSLVELKEQVISPNGTTEAGLGVLAKDDALEELIVNTAQAACDRSRELADD